MRQHADRAVALAEEVNLDRLTLDTNALRDFAWCTGRTIEVRYGNDPAKRRQLDRQFTTLLALRDQGRCELAVTTQLYTDYHRGNEPPAALRALIGPHVQLAVPAISTFPAAFPLEFVDKGELDRILKLTFPGITPHHKKYHSAKKDALQLYAHRAAHRDLFITSDRGILAAERTLLEECSIRVGTLGQYISLAGEPASADG